MFPWRNQNSAKNPVGIEILPDGIAVAQCVVKAGAPALQQLAFLQFTEETQPEQLLAEYVRHEKLTGKACNLVLSSGSYQLLLVEAPDVPDEELRDAVRWRLKDLLNIPLEKAAIDVFRLPKDGTRSDKRMIYVVAAEMDQLKRLVAMVSAAKLSLRTIDIGELAIRNLAVRLVNESEAGRGIAVARIRAGAGSVALYRQGDLYLSRQFELDYNGGLLDDLPVDHLALELQRSLDYYERQMGQAPPSLVYLCGENISADKITPTLRASLATPIAYLDVGAAIASDTASDDGVVQLCLGALGGALRVGQAA